MASEELLKHSRIFEKGCLIKLYHDKNLQHKYLPDLLPGLFTVPEYAFLITAMKILEDEKKFITPENLYQIQFQTRMVNFLKKMKMNLTLSEDQIFDILYEPGYQTSSVAFEDGLNLLYDAAFLIASERFTSDIKYDVSYYDPTPILSRARAIQNAHKVIYSHKYKKRNDAVQDAADAINGRLSYLPTFSPAWNAKMGGWTRGFANTLLARSQHTKSTLMTFDTVSKALNGMDVDVIATEEPEKLFYQRVFAILLKIPIKQMRDQIVKITPEQIKKIKDKLQNRIHFYNYTDFKDVINLLYSLRSEYIWIDHINSILYPGNSNALQNMIGGIPLLLNHEVKYLEAHPRTAIVNLSQVNEKDINKRPGYWKHPVYSDAYGSQALWHHSREFITLYYPYKDVQVFPRQWTGKRELPNATDHDVYLKIEKSSFGELAELRFEYDKNIASFKDYEPPKSGGSVDFLKDLL